MLADRSHDTEDWHRHIVALESEPVIPERCHRREPIDHDWARYRERNIVERSLGWLKQGHRIATRYEKTAASYLGFVLFAAARHWLCNPFANVHDEGSLWVDCSKPIIKGLSSLSTLGTNINEIETTPFRTNADGVNSRQVYNPAESGPCIQPGLPCPEPDLPPRQAG